MILTTQIYATDKRTPYAFNPLHLAECWPCDDGKTSRIILAAGYERIIDLPFNDLLALVNGEN